MLEQFCEWLQNTAYARFISETWFPMVESIHVIALALVVGTIFIVDLRLIGVTSKHLRISQIHDQVLPWTWWAFVLAAFTGLSLFAANAVTYYGNTPFRIKLVLLALAGLNMVYFQFVTYSTVASWDAGKPRPAGRIAGLLSISLWTGVVIAGRWIGFV